MRSRTGPIAPHEECTKVPGSARDVDIFNPYDGYATMAQFFLEAFQWHGVKRGEAFAFYSGDIGVEGPHPFCSSGGNLGSGRTRAPCTPIASSSSGARRRTAGQGSRRDRVRRVHHSQQWRLDHVRQASQLVLRPGAAPGYCVGLLTPASLAWPIAVRSTQFGAGETVIVTDQTMLQTGYGLPDELY